MIATTEYMEPAKIMTLAPAKAFCSHLNTVLITHTFLSADCDTDHALIIKVKVKVTCKHKSEEPAKSKINIKTMKFQEKKVGRQRHYR